MTVAEAPVDRSRLAVYGTLCVKCPVADPALADPRAVARLLVELAIVHRVLVVMGPDALAAVNDLDVPLAQPASARTGRAAPFPRRSTALYVPDIDDALDEEDAKRRSGARSASSAVVRRPCRRIDSAHRHSLPRSSGGAVARVLGDGASGRGGRIRPIWVGDHLLYRDAGRPERGPWEA